MIVKCDYCKKKIERNLFRLKRDKRHFCSIICQGKWQTKNWNGENNPNWTSVLVKCKTCGESFYKHPNFIKQTKLGNFCSKKCWYKWRSKNIKGKKHYAYTKKKISCEICKRITLKTPSEIKNRKRIFCSYKCHGIWKSQNLKGEKNYVWKNGISKKPYPFNWNNNLKESIRRRDNYKCQLCGAPQEEFIKKLPVHHVDYDKNNLKSTNLITLCEGCNSRVNFDRVKWTNYFNEVYTNN